MWKREYSEKRKRRAIADPEYRAKRNTQGNGKAVKRRAYMGQYYTANKDKWRRTEQQNIDRNADRRKRYAEDEQFRERCKASARKRDRIKRFESRLQKQFGITIAEYERMLSDQGGGCAICSAKFGTAKRGDRLAVYHCHVSGKIRGLLCSNCNQGIGKFQDDPRLLERAIRYLAG